MEHMGLVDGSEIRQKTTVEVGWNITWFPTGFSTTAAVVIVEDFEQSGIVKLAQNTRKPEW